MARLDRRSGRLHCRADLAYEEKVSGVMMALQGGGAVSFHSLARAYGLLATSLNETLGEVRETLRPYGHLLPAGRIADLDALLAEFARRRTRIAAYGEVKAGKSTLINAIAGDELSPVGFEPLTSVPVRITYGPQTRWRVHEHVISDLNELTRMMRERSVPDEVVVETPLDLLQLGGQVDLLDTPGVGSEAQLDGITAHALRALDAVILVVRYPALFTRLTRSLMDALESEIGKLLVVWNLDAPCADLSEQERRRHAETLRRNVAGAHELFLVDARAAFHAARKNDVAGKTAAGLTALLDALVRFASSDERQIVALREAAKRADEWLDDAQRVLARREAELQATIQHARSRLQAVADAAAEKTNEVQRRFAEMRSAIGRIGEKHSAGARINAANLVKHIRVSRRRWIRDGNFEALQSAVTQHTQSYAANVERMCQDSRQAVQEAGHRFGTVVPTTPRPRTEPTVDSLAPADRLLHSVEGRLRRTRRALWKRWYLPGLAELERQRIDEDVKSQISWFDAMVRAAEDAGRAELEKRAADIKREAEAETAKIKQETNFDEAEQELQRIQRDLPLVASRRAGVAQMNIEAKALLAR